MSIDFTLNAKVRDEQGKGASRRLRRQAGLVPAIIYGAGKEPQNVSVSHKDFIKALENEAFYTHIISLDVDGAKEDVLLKDLQRHPAKPILLHADFLRVDKTKKVTIKVPLHFINEGSCVGVKAGGGIISHNMTDLEVRCLPTKIPEFIEVDMQEIELGQIVHISDLILAEGVESVQLAHGADHNLAVAIINAPKGGGSEDEDDAPEAAETTEGAEEEKKED